MDRFPLDTREACERADAEHPFASCRELFALPPDTVYLDGNSLGPRPVAAAARAAELLTEWGDGLVRSWNTAGWYDLPTRLGALVSRIVGGADGEVVVTDSTTVNLFKVLVAALRIQRADRPERRVVVVERHGFPTDGYLAQGLVDLLDDGYRIRWVDTDDDLHPALDDETAVLLLSHVDYRTGRLWDLADVTAAAHAAGALVIWDVAHSAGAVPVDLGAAGADFAVGCTYKYLNGGPGAPAFVWVAQRHQDRVAQPLTGWWGHARPFAMEPDYVAAQGIRRYLCGTPPVASMAIAECGLQLAASVDTALLRQVSLAMSEVFVDLVERRCAGHGLELASPREQTRRGSHVSLRHPEAFAVMSALIERGVIGDYREPGLMRFAITPLYLRYVDLWDAVEVLRDVLDTRSWDTPAHRSRPTVT